MDIHHCRSIPADPPFDLSSSSCLSLPADTETNTLKNLLVSAAAGLLNVSEFANNLLDPSQHHGAAVISTVAIEQKSFGFEPVGLLGFFYVATTCCPCNVPEWVFPWFSGFLLQSKDINL